MPVTSKKTFIAIEAVLYVAKDASGLPVRSKSICEYQGVKLRYLEQIMQALVKFGVLKGVRGPKGGYVLAKERRKISLSEIYEAIFELENSECGIESQSELYEKVIRPVQSDAHDAVATYFSEMTIQDLCEDSVAKGIKTCESSPDFNI